MERLSEIIACYVAHTLALILHTESYEVGFPGTPSGLKSSCHSETAVKEFYAFPPTPKGDIGFIRSPKRQMILTSLQLTYLPYISTLCNLHNRNLNLIVTHIKEYRTS
jgi:hypothetical protein